MVEELARAEAEREKEYRRRADNRIESERREREKLVEVAREEKRQRRGNEQAREEQHRRMVDELARRRVDELARAEAEREEENQRRADGRIDLESRERENLVEVARQIERQHRVDEHRRRLAEVARTEVAKEEERKRRLAVGISNQVVFVHSTYSGID